MWKEGRKLGNKTTRKQVIDCQGKKRMIPEGSQH